MQAQDPCGFDQAHRRLLKSDADYKKAFILSQNNIKSLLTSRDFSRTDAQVYTIPVVVHVINNGEPVGTGSNISDAQIQSAINSLTRS